MYFILNDDIECDDGEHWVPGTRLNQEQMDYLISEFGDVSADCVFSE